MLYIYLGMITGHAQKKISNFIIIIKYNRSTQSFVFTNTFTYTMRFGKNVHITFISNQVNVKPFVRVYKSWIL